MEDWEVVIEMLESVRDSITIELNKAKVLVGNIDSIIIQIKDDNKKN